MENPLDSLPPPSANPLDSLPPPAPEETAGRVAGLGARALLKGGADLVGTAYQGARAMSNLGAPGSLPEASTGPYKPQLSDFVHPERWQQAAEYFAEKGANAAGLPTPATAGERIASRAVEALPSAALTPETPILGALSAAAGGAASQGVKEAGGGVGLQTVAGLAAGAVPAVAGSVVNAARGVGVAAPAQAAIDEAAASGTTLTAGQATGSRVLNWAQNAVGGLPGGGGVVERNAAAQRAGLSDKLDDIVSNLSGGQTPTATTAGEAVQAGGKNAIAQLRADDNTAYGAVDSLVPETTGIDVSKTNNVLKALTTPTPGAEATTGALISPKLKELAANLEADVKAGGGTLPYNAARAAKSALGEQIDWSPFPTDPANGQLKQVYNALRDDINTGASQVSPEAAAAVKTADAQYTEGREKLSALQKIIGNDTKAPEAVFNAALNGTNQNGGATIVNRALEAMNPEQKSLFGAAILKRMGTASPGQQGAEGGAFSADQFLTNWNKMNPEAKSAIFDSLPGGYRKNLDAFASTVDRIKQSGTVLANPSGTAGKLSHQALMADLISAVPMAFVAPLVAVGQVAAGLGIAAGANIGARVLTNPAAVRWLAQSTKVPGMGAAVANQAQELQAQP